MSQTIMLLGAVMAATGVCVKIDQPDVLLYVGIVLLSVGIMHAATVEQ